jgi:hypothetical protein
MHAGTAEPVRVSPPEAVAYPLELDIQLALGPALAATRSFAALEVETVYTRARELCQQVGESPQLFPVLAGLRLCYTQRAEYQRARALGEQILSLAQRVQEPALLAEAPLVLTRQDSPHTTSVFSVTCDRAQHRTRDKFQQNLKKISSSSQADRSSWM